MTETFKTCAHLEPLERDLAANGIALGEGMVSPYGAQWGTWFPANCTFEGEKVLKRLHLPECVKYTEYDGRVAGSDATFYCSECQRAIMGMIPRYAPAGTPRIE
jgi:hypothetical protein